MKKDINCGISSGKRNTLIFEVLIYSIHTKIYISARGYSITCKLTSRSVKDFLKE